MDLQTSHDSWVVKYDHPLYAQLVRAYCRHHNSSAALAEKPVVFYDGVSYAVRRDRSESGCVRVNIGDIVDVLEKTEGVAYAKVMNIVCHQANDSQFFAFFVFD